MTLEVPETVTLSDGSTAEVKAERRSGAWMDVPEAEVQRPVTIAAGAKRSANGGGVCVGPGQD
jgi:hypothetical protein